MSSDPRAWLFLAIAWPMMGSMACTRGASDEATRAAPAAAATASERDEAAGEGRKPHEGRGEGRMQHDGHEGHEARDEQAQAERAGEAHGGHHGHRRFDDPARFSKMFDSEERIAWQKPDALIAGLELAEDAVIADIGAGTGTFAVRFARALPKGKVFANDVEAAMVAHLRERAAKEGISNLVAVLGTAEDPKLPEGLDLAFVCDVFHHIEDPTSFFGHVQKSLKPEGRLVIVDFKKDAPEGSPGPPKAMRLRAEEVIAALSPLGFSVARLDETTLEFQYVIVLTRGG